MTPKFHIPTFACLLGFAAINLLGASQAFAEDSKEPLRTVSVSGTGTIKMAPDQVNISTGVESDAPTAKDALAKNTAAMTKVVEALKASGIEAKDIQTTNFSVEPRYDTSKDDDRPPRVVGYRVSNSVYITVRDVAKLGEVLDKVVSLGANQIGGISFGVSDFDAVQMEARKAAMADALARAKLYAEGAGATLGRVLTISEQGGYQPVYERMAAAPMAAKASAPAPIEAGTSSVSVQISVTWELE